MKSGIEHIVSTIPVPRSEFESEQFHNLTHGNAFPASPVERQLFYRDDEHLWYQYNGTAWVSFDVTTHAGLTTGVHAFDQSCLAYNDGDVVIPDATWTIVPFPSEFWDTNNMHDLVTNPERLTCKVAGKYFIYCCIRWAPNVTGRRSAKITKNVAGTMITFNEVSPQPVTGQAAFNATGLAKLAVNDYVEVYVYQSSGGNLNVDGSPADPAVVSFGMARIP